MSAEEKLPITKEILNERIGHLIEAFTLIKTKISDLEKLIPKRIEIHMESINKRLDEIIKERDKDHISDHSDIDERIEINTSRLDVHESILRMIENLLLELDAIFKDLREKEKQGSERKFISMKEASENLQKYVEKTQEAIKKRNEQEYNELFPCILVRCNVCQKEYSQGSMLCNDCYLKNIAKIQKEERKYLKEQFLKRIQEDVTWIDKKPKDKFFMRATVLDMLKNLKTFVKEFHKKKEVK